MWVFLWKTRWEREPSPFLERRTLRKRRLPILFVGHWINQHSPCVSWHGITASHGSLSLVMRSLTNTYGFWSNDNCDSQQVVSERRSRVRYTPGSRWGEIVGHRRNQRSLCVLWHGLTASRGFLSLAMRSLNNTCGFWSNNNRDSQHFQIPR